MLSAFMKKNILPDEFILIAKKYYQPLAERIFNAYSQKKTPFVVGVNGCQGSGKSTLSEYIADYLSTTGELNVVVVSLDDFYLSRQARSKLAEDIHPLLKTRGVPGTHDAELLKSTLDKFKNKQTNFTIPRFNKATDDPYNKSEWQHIKKPIDILIIEGWCWGVTAQNDIQLTDPINTLESIQDSESIWRTYVNEQLQSYYQPLYQYVDFWVALQAPSFDSVYKWRLEQEQKLIKKTLLAEQTNVMNEEDILNFIQYFQRLTTHGMLSLPLLAHTIFYLDDNRSIKKCVEKE